MKHHDSICNTKAYIRRLIKIQNGNIFFFIAFEFKVMQMSKYTVSRDFHVGIEFIIVS